MERNQIREIIEATDIVSVVGRYVNLQKRGVEHVGVCPFHDDKHASLKVNGTKQIFKCFACDAGGDVVAFLTAMGRSFPEAMKELKGDAGITTFTPEQREARNKARKTWTVVKPTKPAPMSALTHYRHGQPSMWWAYKDAEGTTTGYVARFDTPEGKEVLPLMYAESEGKKEWRWMGFPDPRPLYGLDKLAAAPNATIIVVEGEKCADAAQRLLPTAVAVAWPGGSKAIDKVDWSPLKGRRVLLWPDHHTEDRYGEKHPKAGQVKPWAEQDGNAAMLRVAALLAPIVEWVRWIEPPSNAPHKWDIADALDWTKDQAVAYVKANVIPVPSIDAAPEPEQEPEPQDDAPPFDAPPPVDAPPPFDAPFPGTPPPFHPGDDAHNDGPSEDDTPPFRYLGYDKNESGQQSFYFYVHAAKKVLRFAATSLASVPNLITIAPLNYWEMHYPGKNGIAINAAVNALVQRSNSVGIYRSGFIRGRGAWMDAGRVVVHAGDRLIVDGRMVPLSDLQTRYIYELSEELDIATERSLDAKGAQALMEMCKLLNWERDISAYLLAGWCVIAPVCGALSWRPHIWLTGAAGTGKSWVFQKIVRVLLGNTALAVQGETTEAGLRQTLRHDALPVVFDEAEGEDRKAAERMQQVLTIMRAASTDDGGRMVKGSATGDAKTYHIRSCFAFASIGVQVSLSSDRSRVTILGLRKPTGPDAAERWKRLQKLYAETMTPDFVAGMQARTIQLLPTLLKNADTFSAAAAAVLGEQRAGDQIGALLAGAYALHSSKAISYDEAVAWVKERDWSEERPSEDQRDEWQLFSHLMEELVRVDVERGTQQRSIGELAHISCGIVMDDYVSMPLATQTIKRLGFKVDSDEQGKSWLFVSNTAATLKKMLRDTPWSRNHNKILLRLPGAESVGSTKFASGVQTRAVRLPMSLFR